MEKTTIYEAQRRARIADINARRAAREYIAGSKTAAEILNTLEEAASTKAKAERLTKEGNKWTT